eukprot:4151082-Amphidinium_carterae.1
MNHKPWRHFRDRLFKATFDSFNELTNPALEISQAKHHTSCDMVTVTVGHKTNKEAQNLIRSRKARNPFLKMEILKL